MRRIIFALIALTVIAAATAKAEIFRYGSLVFVGDERIFRPKSHTFTEF